jgi:transposase
MHPLSTAKCDCVITLLNSGTSAHDIHHLTGASTGTISKIRTEYCPELPKSSGGCPCKLTAADINYAKCLIQMRKADNAVQVTKALKDVTNQSISSQIVLRNLREFGLRPVVKRKCPLLKACHRRERLQGAKSILWRTGKGFFGLMKPKSII